MLQIAIIDDEPLALQYLDLLLRKIEGVHVSGKYMNPEDLIQHIQTEQIDAVFIDIHMPAMKGTDLAEQLLNINPSLHIGFVTAYDNYAIKAFELNAVDYILKPVKQERLAITVQRIIERKMTDQDKAVENRTTVLRDLGALQIYQGNKRIDIKWRTSKAKELFAYFIHHHEDTIRKSELIDLLWSNLPWEKANAQLYTTVYQIRKVMQQIDAPIKIISQKEFYQIDIDYDVQIQSREFKLAAYDLLKKENINTEQYFKVLDAYQDEYLAGLDYLWAVSERKILRDLWLELIIRLSAYLHRYEKSSSYNISKLKGLTDFDAEAAEIVKEKSWI
ncbi:DNA-binding response regulator [Oceanobacillus oncorhynchi subsp. incaldanensis]|uniref:Transcriptional regulatory protein YehT n=2 Tax=Oceanobacillus TaxID=182709 RepID=A0A0A1MJ89_9BACI|nr:response regulator [Oceanobacillus oncorhynchi]MDM8102335.1 response regulator [Oceanobacillus oncorhynchi]UUI41628.1 response regulator [Oceanobacillus oncorhynchi]GIO17775.1 DNA-binding response regulator [Oceanobacillus oncorhynchi subsp. incaldanensis]CEI83158.1 Transcriptional regulatory protein YehT [Oceanobacillus oncorhynchi]